MVNKARNPYMPSHEIGEKPYLMESIRLKHIMKEHMLQSFTYLPETIRENHKAVLTAANSSDSDYRYA